MSKKHNEKSSELIELINPDELPYNEPVKTTDKAITVRALALQDATINDIPVKGGQVVDVPEAQVDALVAVGILDTNPDAIANAEI
jgi:hypothetical protein